VVATWLPRLVYAVAVVVVVTVVIKSALSYVKMINSLLPE
jgi:hypothetical protein